MVLLVLTPFPSLRSGEGERTIEFHHVRRNGSLPRRRRDRGIERYNKWHFRQADGTILERWTGAAFVHVAGKRTSDDIVFGEPGDLVLLGSRTLEGLNFRIEPVTRRLVDAGPAPAAAAA